MNVAETTPPDAPAGPDGPGRAAPPRNVAAVVSMLHEPRLHRSTVSRDASEPAGGGPAGGDDSSTRLFRGKPVLAWTLERLARSKRVGAVVVVCRDDQFARVFPIADRGGAGVLPVAEGAAGAAAVETIAAARRWSDGWRGGLLQTCEFDRGFSAARAAEAAEQFGSDALLLLVDPAAALVDAALLDDLVDHARGEPGPELIFSPAAPGLSGVLLRPRLLARLAAPDARHAHPGKFLHYLPDDPIRDPLAGESCAPLPAPLARTTHRFTLDSRRQVERLNHATETLEGQLPATGAGGLLGAMDDSAARSGGYPADALPREVVLELTPRRAARPVFSPAGRLALDRPDLAPRRAAALFAELAAYDDVRLTLAGAGDPLLSPHFFEIVRAARAAGIRAVRVETDLLGVGPEAARALAGAPIDVLSVHLPAATAATYARVMGVDGLPGVVENLRAFLAARRSGLPILVPLFTKCRDNLTEMEAWYDHWLRVLGAAVVAGPSDYAGQIPDAAVADMAPPRRRPCARLGDRVTVLSDGRIVACEQDVLGLRPLGEIGRTLLRDVWSGPAAALRADHAAGRWDANPLCARCREWHRA